jgi:hypothetical protein
MPPVIDGVVAMVDEPFDRALMAANPDAHAASVVKLGPRKSNRLAIRPAMTLASSPGIVSSVISP